MNTHITSDVELASKFMQLVTAESGKVLSRRFSKNYLNKVAPELIAEILQRTAFLDETYEIRERVFFLQNSICHAPTCIVCGNAVHVKPSAGWEHAKLTDVCSSTCWHHHPNKSTLLKKAFETRDEQSAKIKREQTMMSKFGVAYTLQRDDMKQRLKSRLNDSNQAAFNKLSNKMWIEKEYIVNQRPLTHIAEELNCYYGTVGEWVKRHGFEIRSNNGAVSYTEIECREYVQSLGVDVIENTRSILPDGKELDIYIPDKNIAIEIDGVFWHSFAQTETTHEKRAHINKTLDAAAQGIQLLHFWCVEWNEKNPIVKSMIAAKLGISERIWARNCTIKEISPKNAREFLNANHLSGFNGAAVHVGLFYHDELVHVTSFGKSRFNKNHRFEIIRSASILEHTVVGGLGRCFSYFVKNFCSSGDKIISYADRRFSTGESYAKIGFTQKVDDQSIGYWWVKDKGPEHRSNYQKHLLKSKFPCADHTQSEAEIMFSQGYRRLWDCGNLMFEYEV